MKTNKQFFIVATVLTGLFAYAGHYANHKSNSPARIVFGTFALGAVLSLIAEFNPYSANMLGLVIMTTSFLMNGKEVTDLLTNVVGSSPASAPQIGGSPGTVPAGVNWPTSSHDPFAAPSGDHAGLNAPGGGAGTVGQAKPY